MLSPKRSYAIGFYGHTARGCTRHATLASDAFEAVAANLTPIQIRWCPRSQSVSCAVHYIAISGGCSAVVTVVKNPPRQSRTGTDILNSLKFGPFVNPKLLDFQYENDTWELKNTPKVFSATATNSNFFPAHPRRASPRIVSLCRLSITSSSVGEAGSKGYMYPDLAVDRAWGTRDATVASWKFSRVPRKRLQTAYIWMLFSKSCVSLGTCGAISMTLPEL